MVTLPSGKDPQMPQRGERLGAAATPEELAAVAEVRFPRQGPSGWHGRAPHAWPREVVARTALACLRSFTCQGHPADDP